MVHITVLMMVKNEKKRLKITLNSIANFADSITVYDTGSTDNTIQIFKDFSEKHSIPLRLKEGEFVDFSTSRNIALEFVESFEDVDYALLMDVNDELKGGDKLRIISEKEIKHKDRTCYLLCQQWYSPEYTKYYNTRFIKIRNGWRYKGSVHEYLWNDNKKEKNRITDEIVLYQDRTQDDDKTSKRFDRDKVFLMKDYDKDPKDSRTLFYLAQTCACLHDYEEAYYYYKCRTQVDGFKEEKFHSYLRLGDMASRLGHEWSDIMTWFIKAFEFTARVEPLVKIATHYRDVKKWKLAYMHISMACELKYPENTILFVDNNSYEYTRWHIMGIVGYCTSRFEEGEAAVRKAIETRDQEVDKGNLKFYIDRKAKAKGETKKEVKAKCKSQTRVEFIKSYLERRKNDGLPMSKLNKKARSAWKKNKYKCI